MSYARGSGKLSIQPETIKTLVERFGKDDLEKLLKEYDIAGKLEALTEKQGRFILKQSGLDTLRNRILTEARAENIHPDTWQIQGPVSREEVSSPEDHLFSRTTLFAGGGLTVADVTKAISPIIKGSPYPVQVKQSVNELPQHLQDDMKIRSMHRSPALYDNGTVWMIADNILNPNHAKQSLLHEMFHDGIRKAAHDIADKYPGLQDSLKDIDKILNEVLIVKRKQIFDHARKYYFFLDLTKTSDQFIAAEEWLAHQAETADSKWYAETTEFPEEPRIQLLLRNRGMK